MQLFFFFSSLFKTAPLAHGSSWARRKIGAAAATATPDASYVCDLGCSLWQCGIFIPLNKARDQTWVLMDTSCVLNLLSHNGNSDRCNFDVIFLEISLLILDFLPPTPAGKSWQLEQLWKPWVKEDKPLLQPQSAHVCSVWDEIIQCVTFWHFYLA